MGFSHVSSLLFKDSAGESVIVVLIVLPDTFQIMGKHIFSWARFKSCCLLVN